MNEEWRWVVGFEGLYQVSSEGRIRGQKGQILSVKPSRTDGYCRFQPEKGGTRYGCTVHAEMLKAFVGPRPSGYHVRHLNGVRHDNRLDNLCWGTVTENMADKVTHGTQANLNKTACPRGHSYEGWNLGQKRGGRFCRSCSMAAAEAWRMRERFNTDIDKDVLADSIYERKQCQK